MEQQRLWTPTQNNTPQWMLDTAQELNDKYPNLNLSWIPPENRGPDDDKPFAIVEIDRDGNTIGIVARFTQLEFYPANIFNWLWMHDTAYNDVWGNMLKEQEETNREREKKNTEHVHELADMFSSIVRSQKHTYRINGHKVGAENNVPTIGLFDASGED